MKKVTEILCFYNEEKFLSIGIESLLKQSYEKIEIILINDGSTDNSLEIAKSYNDDRIVIIDNDENHGLAWCRNQGLEVATGDYVGFTDADDISRVDRIELLTKYLDNNPDIDIVSSNCIYIDEEGKSLPEYDSDIPTEDMEIRMQLLFGNPILGPGAIFRKKIITELGIRNNPELRVSQDWHFWLQCIQHCKIHMIDDKPYSYRIHESKANQFAKKNKEIQAKWRAEIIKYGWNSIGISINDDEAMYIYNYVYRQYRFLNPIIYGKRKKIKRKIEISNTTLDKKRIEMEFDKRVKQAWYL